MPVAGLYLPVREGSKTIRYKQLLNRGGGAEHYILITADLCGLSETESRYFSAADRRKWQYMGDDRIHQASNTKIPALDNGFV
jgi:hypothetical protein